MKRIGKFYLIIFSIILLLHIFCSDKPQGLQVITLLDFSGSLSDEEFDKYISMFRQGVLINLTTQDAITLVPIDKASETKFEIIDRCDMSEIESQLKMSTGRYDLLTAEEKIESAYKAILDTLFQTKIKKSREERKKYTSKTDIVAAIKEVVPYWQKTDYRTKILFIFSDMIQESEDIDMKKIRTSVECEAKLNELSDYGLLPDLANVSVFVCGATSEETQEYRLCKEFWEKYFMKTKADLFAYGYGNYYRISELLNINRMYKE